MKLFISVLLTLAFSFTAFAEEIEIPEYGPETVVAESEHPVYKEALFEALYKAELVICTDDENRNLSINFERLLGQKTKWTKGTLLHLLNSETPLLVIRTPSGSVTDDLEFHTDEKMVNITKVSFKRYITKSFRKNIGTIADPKFEEKQVTELDISFECKAENGG